MDGGGGGCPDSLADKARLFLQQRQLHMSAGLEARRQAEASSLRATPEINANSARIAARDASRAGPRDVGASLHADAEVQRAKRLDAVEAHFASTVFETPAITKRGASVVREGRVGDRLHGSGKLAAGGKSKSGSLQATLAPEQKHRQDLERLAAGALPAGHGEGSKGGGAGGAGGGAGGGVDHAHSLYDLALEKKKRQEAVAHQREVSLRRSAKPSLNERTRKLAADLGPSMERLLKKRQDTDKRSGAAAAGGDLPFRPSINPNSVKILNSSSSNSGEHKHDGSHNTHDRLYREHLSRNARRATLENVSSKNREQRDLEQCTFKPCISKQPTAGKGKGKGGAGASTSAGEVTTRLAEWEKARSKRLELQRQNKANESLGEEYTFQPQINLHRPRKSAAAARAASASAASAVASTRPGGKKADAGVDAHLERQRRAREEKQRRANAVSGTSSGKWTGRLTVPVAPKLGTAARSGAQNAGAAPAEVVVPAGAPLVPASAEQAVPSPAPHTAEAMPSPPPPPPPPPLAAPRLGSARLARPGSSNNSSKGTKVPARAPPPPPMSPPPHLDYDERVESSPSTAAGHRPTKMMFPLDKALDDVLAARATQQQQQQQQPPARGPSNNNNSSPQQSPEQVLQGFSVLNSLLS